MIKLYTANGIPVPTYQSIPRGVGPVPLHNQMVSEPDRMRRRNNFRKHFEIKTQPPNPGDFDNDNDNDNDDQVFGPYNLNYNDDDDYGNDDLCPYISNLEGLDDGDPDGPDYRLCQNVATDLQKIILKDSHRKVSFEVLDVSNGHFILSTKYSYGHIPMSKIFRKLMKDVRSVYHMDFDFLRKSNDSQLGGGLRRNHENNSHVYWFVSMKGHDIPKIPSPNISFVDKNPKSIFIAQFDTVFGGYGEGLRKSILRLLNTIHVYCFPDSTGEMKKDVVFKCLRGNMISLENCREGFPISTLDLILQDWENQVTKVNYSLNGASVFSHSGDNTIKIEFTYDLSISHKVGHKRRRETTSTSTSTTPTTTTTTTQNKNVSSTTNSKINNNNNGSNVNQPPRKKIKLSHSINNIHNHIQHQNQNQNQNQNQTNNNNGNYNNRGHNYSNNNQNQSNNHSNHQQSQGYHKCTCGNT